MISDTRLFSVGSFEFKMNHLLIIGILAIAFSLSMMIRFQGAEFGFELNEFDPYFNYRATEFLVENGLDAYGNWHDDMAWYPIGRDISATSQIMLHYTAAASYYIFGGGMDLYEFLIYFPAVIGSLTAVVAFAVVRTVSGTTAGLFAALLFAISPSIIVRGTMGWFKSEPLGLFYGLLAAYFFLSGIRSENRKVATVKLAAGGATLAFGLSSWGGIQYFVIPIAIFILALPFFRQDHRFLLWAVPLFGAVFLATTSVLEWPGPSFVAGMGGATIIASVALMAATIFIKSRSGTRAIRNCLIFLLGSFAAAMSLLYVNSLAQFLPGISFRYANALNPFLTTVNPLVDSVAEHATATTSQSFWFLSVLMIFAGIGAWLILSRKLNRTLRGRPEMAAFALIIGITGVYVSSSFIRLELFASLSVIILSSIALATISEIFFNPEKSEHKYKRKKRSILHATFVASVVALLVMPMAVPANGNWVNGVKAPPTILNGGTSLGAVSSDWLDALNWIKTSTPPDSIVAAWWDYGYWITTVGERISLADNGTLNHERIAAIAKMMLSHPDEAWLMLQDLQADYVLLFIAAQNIDSEPPTYLLNGGGDEQKNYWFVRIAEEPVSRYIHEDLATETDFFWQNTMMGQMVPFSPRVYLNAQTNEQSRTWQPGYIALVEKDVKLPEDGDGPLRLAYASPSFYAGGSPIIGVFIYEVNKDYVPGQPTQTTEDPQAAVELAAFSTGLGNVLVQLDDSAAPGLAASFASQANSGLYNGTSFHHVIPGILLQGGDPDAGAAPQASGAGAPTLPTDPMFGSAEGAKYRLAAASADGLEGPSPQFYIINSEVPWISGSYTAFGTVISGEDVIDAMIALETDEQSRPLDAESARILEVRVETILVP